MTAALAAVIPTSRRISAGIEPAEGASARLPAWWSREDWLEEVTAAVDARPELLRAYHVSRDAVLACARAHAAYANHRNGRSCRPTNARLVEAMRCSLSTVQRARRVLEQGLELIRRQIQGRSMMTRAERLTAWERGSSHRQIAAEFALCSRRRRAPKRSTRKVGSVLGYRGPGLRIVDGDTPPGAPVVEELSHLPSTSLRRRTENEEGGQAPRSYRGGLDGRPRRLAEGVRDRIGWLRGTSYKRLAPLLGKFARQDWTVRDVDLAIRDQAAALGWKIPRDLKHPAAYLARLLREVDPAERPSVLEDAYEAARRAEAAAERAARRARVLALAGKCVHGVPALGAGQPSRGVLACLACHRAGESS